MTPINIWYIMFLNTKDLFVNRIHFCIKFKFNWHIFKHSNSRWFCSNSKDMKIEVKSASDQISLFFVFAFYKRSPKFLYAWIKKKYVWMDSWKQYHVFLWQPTIVLDKCSEEVNLQPK